MTTVILDTNALMMPVELDIRVFDELDRLLGAYEVVTVSAVIDELTRLAARGGPAARAAQVGIDLARRRCRIIETGDATSSADDEVFRVATTGSDNYVVTNDLPLRDRLLDAGVSVISVRGRNKLEFREP